MSFLSLLQAQAGGASTTGSFLSTFLLLGPMILVVYFLIIRPQNKKQKELEKTIAALKKGDKVVTVGGIHGVVSSTKEKTIIVKVDDNTKIEFNRTAIATVVNPQAEKSEKQQISKSDKAEEKGSEQTSDDSADKK